MIFNGVTFDDFVVIEYVRRNLLPPRTVEVLNTGGVASHFGKVLHGVDTIEVDVRVIEKTREEVLDIYDTLATALYTDKPQPIRLRDRPGKYNMAILNGSTNLETFLYTGFVKLTFDCPDPYLYNDEPTLLTDVGGVSVMNRGGAPSEGEIKVHLSAATDEVTVSMSGEEGRIKATHAFVAGDIVIFDLKNEAIWKNGSVFVPPDLDSEFFQIPPGFYVVTASSGTVDISYYERWY